jgi:hypothetical protein
MSEWLTTGQMIDRLKIGEVAIPDDEKYLAVKRGMGGFIWVNRHTFEKSEIHKDYFRIDRYTVGLKWRIIPSYVSFTEAAKALMNGKTIWLWEDGEKKIGYYIDKESGKLWAIVGELAGKVDGIQFGSQWTIEE